MNRTMEAHEAMPAATESEQQSGKVRLFGVAMVEDRKFQAVEIVVPSEFVKPLAPPVYYMENAYDKAIAELDDHGLRRAPDRFREDFDG